MSVWPIGPPAAGERVKVAPVKKTSDFSQVGKKAEELASVFYICLNVGIFIDNNSSTQVVLIIHDNIQYKV